MPEVIQFSGQSPFPYNPVHTAIAIAYRNPSLIADEVFPRVPVPKKSFQYRKYPSGQSITVPNTHVGRKGSLNEVEMTFTEETDTCRDYGLLDKIPVEDVDNAPEGYDPVGEGIEWLTDLILLAREVRAANLLFNVNSFATGYKLSLEGSSQWSHPDSNPVLAIENAVNTPMVRPNIGVFGQSVWSVLRQHPRIVKAVHGNSGDSGLVTRKQFADLFELEDVYVGSGWVNSSKPGQAVTSARIWGKYAAFIHRNRMAGAERGITFGFTGQFRNRIAGARPNPNIGLHGGNDVIAGESVRELITAPDLGYLFANAIA